MATYALWKTLRIFNYNRCISCNFSSLCANKQTLQVQVTPKWVSLRGNSYCDVVTDDPAKSKKKKEFIPRITLLFENDDMKIVTLEEAQKLAKRRDLKLVKIVDFDTRTERPVYKLMNIQDFIKEEAKVKAEAKEARDKTLKEDKTIALSSKIAEHDLNIKIKSMHKMLGKRHGVRVLITIDGNKEKAVEVRDYIVQKCKEIAKPVTKSDAAFNLKVTLRPILDKTNQEKKKDKEGEKIQKEETDVH